MNLKPTKINSKARLVLPNLAIATPLNAFPAWVALIALRGSLASGVGFIPMQSIPPRSTPYKGNKLLFVVRH